MTRISKKIGAVLIFCLTAFAAFSEGVLFSFKHNKGDSVSYVSTVNEEVLLNGKFNHKAVIVNRISSQIKDVLEDGTGVIHATYMTTEQSESMYQNIQWGEDFESNFNRRTNGEMEIDDDYFMPTVRNVPVFPDHPVQLNESWTAEGHEAEDLRNTFGIEKPYKIPFTARYSYLRDEETDNGKILNVISVNYTFYYESPTAYIDNLNMPSYTMGNSSEIIYWDNEKGIIDHYNEDFKIIIETYAGDIFTFRGRSGAEVTEFKSVNNEANLKLIEETVNNLEIEDVSVKKSEKGLTISIENIQFEPDSAKLRPSEKEKLKKIASILTQFNNDLLVTGHCAERGTANARQRLSEERADAVANYLKGLKVRDRNHIFTLGKGSKEPVASNATEEGRMKNRRVEITILD